MLETYRQCCGADGPLLLEVTEGSARQVVEVATPYAIIGREPGVELLLDHPDVSRRHAFLHIVDGRPYCVDLKSRKGIFWPDGPGSSGFVHAERGITIGPYRLRVLGGASRAIDPSIGGAPGSRQDPQKTRRHDLPPLALEFPDWITGPPSWPIRQTLTFLGRATDCRVHLSDVSVSRFHCCLILTPGGGWLVDLFTREGTRVNGMPTTWTPLRDGDRAQLGRYAVVFHLGEEVARMIDRKDPELRALPHASAEAGFPDDRLALPPLPPARASKRTIVDASDLVRPKTRARRTAAPSPSPDELLDAGALDPATGPMIGQIMAMQQQMFDQFQQAMTTMCQMFIAMHRDQKGQVEQELESIRGLSREIRSLQRQLLNGPAPGGPGGAETDAGPEEPPTIARSGAIADDLPTRNERHEKQVGEGHRSDRNRPGPGSSDPAGSPSTPRDEPDRSHGGRSDLDPHAHLVRRMAELQREQQTRWQRLFRRLSG